MVIQRFENPLPPSFTSFLSSSFSLCLFSVGLYLFIIHLLEYYIYSRYESFAKYVFCKCFFLHGSFHFYSLKISLIQIEIFIFNVAHFIKFSLMVGTTCVSTFFLSQVANELYCMLHSRICVVPTFTFRFKNHLGLILFMVCGRSINSLFHYGYTSVCLLFIEKTCIFPVP